MLELTGICKRFGPTTVLDDVALSVRPGEFLSLLGPSGCGKTTLLRIIAGLERPDRGDLKLDGQSIRALPVHRRPFNLIFQRYALFPHLDVEGNVGFGLRMKGLAAPDIKRKVAAALDLVAMEGFEARAVQTLSGGQQQRVAIARALVNEPRILLLDEPLAALDLKLRQRMQVELRALQRRLGITFVYVTHAQDEALTLSDRVAVINQGRIEQIDTPKVIYEKPATPFVATFIGSINRIPANLAGLTQASMSLWLRPEQILRLDGSPTRPALSLAGSADTAGDDGIRVRVEQVFYKGSHLEVMAVAAAAPGVTVTMHLPTTGSMPKAGDTINVGWAKNAGIVMPDDGAQP